MRAKSFNTGFLRLSKWVALACAALFVFLFNLMVWDVIHVSRTWKTVIYIGFISSTLIQPFLFAIQRRRLRE
jgi:hypothetical protein